LPLLHSLLNAIKEKSILKVMAGVPVTHSTLPTSDQEKDLIVTSCLKRSGVSLDLTILGRYQLASQSRDGSRSHRSLEHHLRQEINFSSWLLQCLTVLLQDWT